MDQPPPSSRSSIDAPTQATQGPIPLFDVHLRHLTDSYLNFFLERRKIEEFYVDSLRKLYRKVKAADAGIDEKGETSTLRGAWSEVVESVDREFQTRQAFLATLSGDLLTPLTNLKETQERTRKRIKEDLKDSTQAYNEYAEVVLPRLKTRYQKKYAEVEEQKRAATAPATQTMPPPTSHSDDAAKSSGGSTRPQVTGPQPLRALDRRPSGSYGGRQRSPSGSNTGAFADLAHQGKKQLNQLITFLDKGGSVKDGLGAVRESQALRNVRAKREADEADKEYRKGVHWLETLRLRRTKILENGYKSLEMFIEEESTTMKRVLVKYTDNMVATTSTQTQLSTLTRSIVDRISPEKDLAKVMNQIPRSLQSAIPDPILYEHGQVGECNDLIFGFSLVDYAVAKQLPEGAIPKIVKLCVAEIDKRGLESEGIYRISGRHAVVQAMQHGIEKDEAKFTFSPKDDMPAVASLLKLYLRELPEPVFRFALQDRIQHTEDRDEHICNNFALLRSKIRRLPPVHQATLKALIEHLARVAEKSEKNKMDAKNLAIVFGSVIFGEDEMPKDGNLLTVQTIKDTLMEDLIVHAHILYDHPQLEQPVSPPQPQSPPLPPTPAGEPVAPITYGSKTTKMAIIQPDSAKADIRPVSPPQDFMPRLPPRPNNSIHPSSRLATSPSRSRAYPEKPLPLTVPEQQELHQKRASDESSSHSTSPPGSASEKSERNSVMFPVRNEGVPVTSSDAPPKPASLAEGNPNPPPEAVDTLEST
ncbi:hypothetical protein CPB83DRAFT_862570 [Crepidotus variabilis]|uniref:Rho-GAP domain-containing protein n=1 Tax=Crepidotus variabilis TaxID=179855 RepID=A0A9P6E6L4_9AGAR|nr:hypothetical protein CPB83DRAFT_862570 [Crepidotus variabilis]